MRKQRAILIVGPTGAGKTPLGDLMAQRGWAGCRCHHFDFGARLRAAAEGNGAAGVFSPRERGRIRSVLAAGRLLEDREFPIARKVLQAFAVRPGLGPADLVVLNGLPRHRGQAQDLADLADVVTVVVLRCGPRTAWKRIRTNAGGDRGGRADDETGAVAARIRAYRRRTVPLVDYYRGRGARILELRVGPDTTAEQMWQALEDAAGGGRADEGRPGRG